VRAKLWDLDAGKAVCALEGLTYTPHLLAFLPDGKTAIVADSCGMLMFYAIPSGKLIRSLRVHAAAMIGALLSHDGTHVLTFGNEKAQNGALYEPNMKWWDITQDRLVQVFDSKAFPLYAIAPDNRLVVAGSDPIHVLSTKTGENVKLLPISDGWAGRCEFAADGKRALVMKKPTPTARSEGDFLVLCEPETGKVFWESERDIHWGRFLPGERLAIAVGSDNTWHTLNLATGKVLRSIKLELGEFVTNFAREKAVFFAQELSLDGKVLVGVVGTNDSPPRPSTMAIQIWRLGRVPTLLKVLPDSTGPHE
jgi:WD40 repeat protein